MNTEVSNDSFVSVSLLNKYIKTRFEDDFFLRNITIRGQISNFTDHVKTGHFYLTLKDENSSIKAVMFNSYSQKVKWDVKNGLDVLCSGTVSVFERDGNYQLYIKNMEPFGIGGLHLAFEQLKAKLEAQGMFSDENKQPIPKFPKSIGIVTSDVGAAIEDIKNTITRRWPVVKLNVYPCQVQGASAVKTIIKSLNKASAEKNDVIILARGGGSFEDLNAFNDEDLAKEIYKCNVPIITGIGHQTDFTIADFVSDLRAATPTGAAELATCDIVVIKKELESKKNALHDIIENTINKKNEELNYNKMLINNLVKEYIGENRNLLQRQKQFLKESIKKTLESKENDLRLKSGILDSLSPLKVLSRGYAIVTLDDNIVKSSDELKSGDTIVTKFFDSTIDSIVK